MLDKGNMISINKDFKYIPQKTVYHSKENRTSFYKAIETKTGRIAGIKTVSVPSPKLLKDFESEINILIGLEGNVKNIPTVYFYDVKGTQITIVMQYIEGETLAQTVEKEKQRFADKNITIKNLHRLYSLSCVLGDIHKNKRGNNYVQHKDLKPQNIIIKRNFQKEEIYIIDFGLSAPMAIRGTGTPLYQSPEQSLLFSGISDTSRIDVFSFGLIMYELLCGKNLILGQDLVWDRQTNNWKSIPKLTNPNLPPQADEILKKCLAFNPRERFNNGGEIACQIRKILPRKQ